MFKSVQKPIFTVLFLLLGLILLFVGGCAKQEQQVVSSDNGKTICVAVSIVPQASLPSAETR